MHGRAEEKNPENVPDGTSVEMFVNFDNAVTTSLPVAPNDDAILNEFLPKPDWDEGEENEEELCDLTADYEPPPRPSSSEITAALSTLDNLLLYADPGDADDFRCHLQAIHRLADNNAMYSKHKQTAITDFLGPINK